MFRQLSLCVIKARYDLTVYFFGDTNKLGHLGATNYLTVGQN